jgi:DNA-binding MarR family transcriptional regulator
MAKQRIVNTRFWDDSYIANLSPEQKLLYLYFLTNPLTNISGVYEVSMKRVAFDTGMNRKAISKTVDQFSMDGKIIYRDGWIGIVNFIKYQTLNPKVKKGILIELEKAPNEVRDRLSIDYGKLSDPNLNINSNSNNNPMRLVKARHNEIIGYEV